MPSQLPRSEPKAATNSAVISPYALAEQIAGRPIKWREVRNVPELLEDLLQTPYDELFDPIHKGPLYTGLRLNKQMQLEQIRSPLLDVEIDRDISDIDIQVDGSSKVAVLADLGPRFDVDDVGTIAVAGITTAANGRLCVTLELPERERLERLAHVLSPALVLTVAGDPRESGASKDWTPPGGSWVDNGRFFNEAAEFFDPVQGAVANCYYIAALSAVAWAQPRRIGHLTRATGQTQEQFANLVRFYKPNSDGQVDKEIEVTDRVPLNSSGGWIYARSSESGEIWPAVYEKAYAKYKTGVTGDQPDITKTAWGDCVNATAQLTGGKPNYYSSGNNSADQLWDRVRANSMSRRTIRPMTAWTYSSGQASEQKIVYSDANIVASHCYAVLGWDHRDGKKFIVLRNPWGGTEATVQTLAGTWWSHDISWWRPITLANPDGTFGIEASAFKTYFGGLGVVT